MCTQETHNACIPRWLRWISWHYPILNYSLLLHILYCTLHCTVQYMQCIVVYNEVYSTAYAVHFYLHCTAHGTLYSTLHTLLYSTLNTVLYIAQCILHSTLHSTLNTILHTAHCTSLLHVHNTCMGKAPMSCFASLWPTKHGLLILANTVASVQSALYRGFKILD